MRRALIFVAATAAAILAASWYPQLAAAPLRQSSSASQRLVLGVVRNDSMLLPFAAFDGRKWSTPWPSVLGGRSAPSLPVSIATVPPKWWGGQVPADWNVWPRGADHSSRLTLQALAMIPVGTNRQVGFRTDHPAVLPAVPPFELPYPKVGIAIAGDATLRPIASVSALTGQWKMLAASLQAEISMAEEQAIRALRGGPGWAHPFAPEQRARVAAELEAWYVARQPESPINLSYIEAVKKYPVLPADEGCGLETFVSGWVRHEDGLRDARSNLRATITYCDRRGVSYMLPFGELQLAGKSYWVVQMSGRDHERYTVIEGRAEGVKYVAEYQAAQLPPR